MWTLSWHAKLLRNFSRKRNLLCFTRLFWWRQAAWAQQEIPLNAEIALQGNFTMVPFHQVGSKAQFFFFLSFFKHLFKGGEEKYILIHPNWFLLQNACDCKPLITSECQPPRTFCFLISNGSFQRLALDCGDFQSIRPSLPNLIQVPSQA